MSAASLLRYARARSNLSQRDLGRRAGVTQASISRIEESKTSPRFETLERLLRACGFELEVTPLKGLGVDRTAMRELLGLTPTERARIAAGEANNLESIRHQTNR